MEIGEEERTRPAEIRETKLEGCAAESRAAYLLTITEGKYHQVKRMMQSQGRTVTYLRRMSMGPLVLGDTLPVGEFRPLSPEELADSPHKLLATALWKSSGLWPTGFCPAM